MNILQVCSFFASYEGNFLKSLYSLDKALEEKGHKTCYAFPQKAFEMQWCRELQKRTKVFALPFKSSRLNTKAVSELKRIIKDEHINIVHSHFEFYDIACKKAAGKSTRTLLEKLHGTVVINTAASDSKASVKLSFPDGILVFVEHVQQFTELLKARFAGILAQTEGTYHPDPHPSLRMHDFAGLVCIHLKVVQPESYSGAHPPVVLEPEILLHHL